MTKYRCHDCRLEFPLRSDAVAHVRLVHKREPRDEGIGKVFSEFTDWLHKLVPPEKKR